MHHVCNGFLLLLEDAFYRIDALFNRLAPTLTTSAASIATILYIP